MSTQEPLKSLAEAESLEEFKALDAARRTAPVQQSSETVPEPSEPKGEPQSETAEAPETPEPRESGEKPKRKTAEARAEELAAEGRYKEARKILEDGRKAHDEELAQLRRENEELKKKGVIQVSPPALEPAPAPKPPEADTSDPEPDLDEYMQKYPDESLGKITQRYNRDWRDWDKRQTEKTAKARSVQERLAAQTLIVQQKHPDFDQVANEQAIKACLSRLAPPAVLAFRDETDNALEVLYSLVTNPAELLRISGLSPLRQVAEVLSISEKLKAPPPAPPTATPEATNIRPITRVPAPAKHVLGGGAMPDEKPLSAASSYEEFKRLSKKKA